jgi:hypothetical protein
MRVFDTAFTLGFVKVCLIIEGKDDERERDWLMKICKNVKRGYI